MVVFSVYIYGIEMITKFRWENGFLRGGSMEPPPLCTNGSAGYLMQLSVNMNKKDRKSEMVNHCTDNPFNILNLIPVLNLFT